MRAPDAPTGWPMEMAPPLTLTLSTPISKSRMDWIATDANASLISNSSTCSGVSPSRPSALAMALDGCDSSDGSGPATVPCAPTSARTGAPSSSALALDITTTAAAPSEICDDEPAVTVPSGANAGRSLANVSAVVSARTPSSSVTRTGSPFRWGTGTGTISSSNRPFFIAAAARPCDIAE
jgi:hypothetical protein